MEQIQEIKTEEKLLSDLNLKVINLDIKNGEDDLSFLEVELVEVLEDELNKYKFKSENLKVYYSLSYCQGDGFCFIGDIITKNAEFNIKHDSRYYHERSTEITITSLKVNKNLKNYYDLNEKQQEKAEEVLTAFKETYYKICKEMEKIGYTIIEGQEQDNILRSGFNDFLTENNFKEDELFNFDYKTEETKGYIKVCNMGNTSIKGLWIKNQKLKQSSYLKAIAEISKYQIIEFI